MDHIRCEDFVFRIADVDGFSHQSMSETEPMTIVNFKGYTQAIPDAQRKLFDFLIAKLKPQPADEIF
jgi:hypothetical protein